MLTRTGLLDLMARHGLEPHRTLGQNFLVDPNTIRKIVRIAAVGPGDRVIEIGPGLGSLTLGLLEAGAEVTAVEIDDRLIEPLRESISDRARIVNADAMEVDWSELIGRSGDADGDERPWAVVATLPYNVATPVVLRLLDEVPEVTRLLVMVQKEVGERLVAGPGTKAYGIPSVKVGYWATARLAGSIGPDVFHPKPRVDSVLVEIVRRPRPVDPVDADLLFDLVRAGFGHRRKTLRRALDGRVDEAGFVAAGIDPQARAETLDVAAWCALTRAVAR